MTPRQAGRIAAFGTLGVIALLGFGKAAATGGVADLLINAGFFTLALGAPLAASAGVLTYVWRTSIESSGAGAGADRPGDEWIAAIRNELAAVDDPGQRRHFARAMLAVAIRRTLTAWVWLLAAGVAAALTLGLLAVSRAEVGDGVGNYTLFVPPLVFFVVGAVAARRLRSFSRGLVVAATVAFLSGVAMVPVAISETVRWYSESGVSFFDGEPVNFSSSSAAVRDTLHPVFIVIHLLFWLPGVVLGARVGAREGVRQPAGDGVPPADAAEAG